MAESNSFLNIVVRVRDEAAGAMSRLSNDVSDLGGSLNFAGSKAGILAGALSAIGAAAAVGNVVKAFAESEAQMAKFDAILKTLPPNIQALREQILDVADNALIKFGFGNEEAALSIAKLLQSTNDAEFSFQAFQAAMDLARFKGIGLEEATQALILSFQGMPKLLRQFGIDIDDHASKETILAAIMKATAGQAEAFAATTKGSFDIIRQTFGEFQEALGAIFAPAVKFARNVIIDFVEANGGLEATIERLRPLLYGFALLLAGALVAGAVLAALAFAGLIGIAGVFILKIAAIIAAVLFFIGFWAVVWEQAVAIFDLFSIGVSTVWNKLMGFLRSSFGSVIEWIRGQLRGILDFFDMVVKTVSSPIKAVGGAIQSAGSAVARALGFAEGGIVTRPTLAMIGEGGESEAIIPLSKLRSMGGGVTVVLQGDFYTDTETAERWGNELARIIKNQLNLAIRA